MQDRAATQRESDMIDFLQEAATRIATGEFTGGCLILVGPHGEEYEWFFGARSEHSKLVGVTGMAWQAMALEVSADEG